MTTPTGKQVVDIAARKMCTQDTTNSKMIYKHPPEREKERRNPRVKKNLRSEKIPKPFTNLLI